MLKRCCIIGAGAAGLCAARHALASQWHITIFERSSKVGGTWVYTEEVPNQAYQIHSSMYKNLRTNLPKECMAFPDFPFPPNLPSFMTHENVAVYLRDYAAHFGVFEHIQFNTEVVRLEPVSKLNASSQKWKVSTKNGDSTATDEFDLVFVCNGHYSKPYYPEIDDTSMYTGQLMHSHEYRHPEPFAGKRVACLGAGPSGVDISLDIAPFAQHIYLCHAKPAFQCPLPSNMSQPGGITELKADSMKVDDGNVLKVDAVILCTGYEYDFPFLSKNVGLSYGRRHVHPLYMHLVHIDYPTSLFFIGLCNTICPFPQFDLQVRYAISVASGETKTPSKAEMQKWFLDDVEYRKVNVPSPNLHFLGPDQWAYNRQLASLANIPTCIPESVQKLYDFLHEYRRNNLSTYKSLNFNENSS